MHILGSARILSIELTPSKVRFSRLADFPRRAKVRAQHASTAPESEIRVNVAPGETGAVDGLVGVGGQEEAIGGAAQPDEHAQHAWIEVLRLVHHDRIISTFPLSGPDNRL